MNSIKTLRKIKGWNQGLLAEAAGLEQSTISKVENDWDGITLRNLYKIANALGVPVYYLLTEVTTEAEARLIEIYRSLSDDRKKGWMDMALLAKADDQKEVE